MSLLDILRDAEWDSPFFKVLAANDTGAAAGHQAGIVIPKPLRQFFPELNPAVTSRTMPTVDNRILAELWIGTKHVSTVDSRYQFQTWGGTRTPESRLTDNLGPLRKIRTRRRPTDLAEACDRPWSLSIGTGQERGSE